MKRCLFSLMVISAVSAFALEPYEPVLAVDFDKAMIFGAKYTGGNFTLNTSTPVLGTDKYTGQPFYAGCEEADHSGTQVNTAGTQTYQDSGIKLQWNNPDTAVVGDKVTGVYVWKKEDFANGANEGLVLMVASNDTLSASVDFDLKNNLSEGNFRWLIKDDGQYYLSAPITYTSDSSGSKTLTAQALDLTWYSYDPNTSVSAVSSAASPTLQHIEALGFQMDATFSVNDGSRYFGVKVASFSAHAAVAEEDISPESGTVIDAGLRHQKIEGFGAAIAWYASLVPKSIYADELTDLLFRDLGLDMLRIQNVYELDNYENASSQAINMVNMGEASLGRSLKILMTAWTPPARLKSNTSQAGTAPATLDSDANGYRYADYASWWADSVDYYTSLGVNIDYLSIQNEPNWHPDYSGCAMDPIENETHAGYGKAFEAVWKELALRKGTQGMPKMIGPETIGINKADEYIDGLPQPSHAYAYATHYYQNGVGESPDDLNVEMQQLNDGYGYKPLFQTEFSVLSENTNSVIARKLNLARLIYNGLTLEELSAYFYWALYWVDNGSGGNALINIPSDPSASYTINPEYYAFKHYSAFVHDGWRRLDVSTTNSLLISAFTSPDQDKMSVIVVNSGTAAENLDLTFSNGTVTAGSIYRSTDVLDCELIGTYTNGSSLSMPAQSITTLSLSTVPPVVPENPNILMIAVDDLLPQLRSYGAAQMITPNLDQLASDGYQFNRAHVQQAVCGPSRASIMTGLRPDTTLAYQYNSNFRDTIPWAYTMPMVLSQQGYHSVGIGKIYHVINGENDELSWDETWRGGSGTYGSTGGVAYERSSASDNSLRDGAVTTAAVAKLAQLKNQQPFFYGVGFVRPHLPFVAPSAYWDLYDPADLELPTTDSHAINSSSYAYTSWSELRSYTGIPASGPVSAEQEQNLIHGYYACVSYVDAQIGRLMDALEDQGLAENTIVVVWGDHGWHLGDHGQWCKHTNFERATHIPLIVKVPWMPGASQVDALVEALDIYPTLMDLCEVEPPDHLQGESFRPLLENPAAIGNGEAVSQYPRYNNIMGYALRTDRYRYIEWRPAGSDTPADVELYDHFLDPGEDTNVVASTDSVLVAALSAQLAPYVGDAYKAGGAGTAESFADVLANAGLMGEDALVYADADGDGLNNLFEYANNMDMTTNDYHVLVPTIGTSGLPTYQIGIINSFQALELEYLRRRDASELQYVAEFSGNLVSNVWNSGSSESVKSIDSDWERIIVQDSETTETTTNRFGRVRILFNP
ncbi:sulfatase-like hydrolase/transferase [Pontiellaceae bacterium B12227]|nr:sulfatase-like hydrolase/transferase [Pontiellaceae bacterium B12227]